ncbi:hypothetical protein HAX54_047610, partial [Datura stramonium]|nr:hypothetical protein [Datura stramonium]
HDLNESHIHPSTCSSMLRAPPKSRGFRDISDWLSCISNKLFNSWHIESPSVADHPLGPATDHRLGKLMPHQLANQMRALPRADSVRRSDDYTQVHVVEQVVKWL